MIYKETGQYKSELVTMMQASHRARGIQSTFNPEGLRQAITKMDHGDKWHFVMVLHKNDLVSIGRGVQETNLAIVSGFWDPLGR